MGDSAHCCIILRFSALSRDTNLLDRLYPEIQQLRGGEFEAIRLLIHMKIKQEESSYTIKNTWLFFFCSLHCVSLELQLMHYALYVVLVTYEVLKYHVLRHKLFL